MVKIKILLFASMRDRFQMRETDLVLENNVWPSSESLKLNLINELDSRFPRKDPPSPGDKKLSPRSLMLVINEDMVETKDSITLEDDDIVTLIPPVSGG